MGSHLSQLWILCVRETRGLCESSDTRCDACAEQKTIRSRARVVPMIVVSRGTKSIRSRGSVDPLLIVRVCSVLLVPNACMPRGAPYAYSHRPWARADRTDFPAERRYPTQYRATLRFVHLGAPPLRPLCFVRYPTRLPGTTRLCHFFSLSPARLTRALDELPRF